MAKRFTDTEKWKKKFIRNLKLDYKVLWLYILDDCNHAGIWEVDIEVAEIRTGCKFNEEVAIDLLGDNIVVFDNGNKWFIPDFIEFQYGELNPKNRVHESVLTLLSKYKNKGLVRGLKDPKDKDKEKDKDNKSVTKKFSPPTIDEVKIYCLNRKNSVDAIKFINHYQSNGWMVGKNKMKDWKAAVRTWEGNDYSKSQTTSNPTYEKL